jgi:hypothetical protein
MSNAGRQAAYVTPPKRGHLLALAVTTSTQFVDLTTETTIAALDGRKERLFCGKYLTLAAEDDDVYVALSATATGALDPTTTSAIDGTTKAPTVNVDLEECMRIPSGTSIQFLMEGETTPYKYLAFIGAAGGGVLRIVPSSPREIRERR